MTENERENVLKQRRGNFFGKGRKMDRKAFLKRTFQLSLGSGSLILFERRRIYGPPDEKKIESETNVRLQKFKESWLLSLLKNLDEQFDEKTRMKLMEACGRDCARRGAIQMAQSSKGDVSKLVDTLAKFLGKENNFIKGNIVHLTYDKCYCELVAEGPKRLPETYCHCSKGWVSEMFETAAQKPVKVELLQSIKRGAPSCQFLIHL